MTARLLLATSWNNSAVSVQFRSLARRLEADGWEVHLLDDRRQVAPGTEGIAHVHHWPGTGRPAGAAAVRHALALVRDLRPAATIGTFGAGGPLGRAARAAGVPRRIAWYHTISGALAIDRGRAAAPRAALDAALRARKGLVYRAHTDLVAVSAAAAEDLVRVYGPRLPPVVVQHNGVADTGPVRDPAAVDGPVVSVGRLDRSKGHDVLVRAVAASARRPRLVLCGSGPEAGALTALAQQLRVELELAGQVTNDEARRRMADAAVVAVPSRGDAFGLTAVEGMAAGVPVVGSAVGGLVEVVADGAEGRLVPPDDPPALAAALDEALEPARNRAWAAAARAGYLHRYELEGRVEAIARWVGPPPGVRS